jgi:hypothetical protein
MPMCRVVMLAAFAPDAGDVDYGTTAVRARRKPNHQVRPSKT